ncbi:MAG: cyclic nucleotide-binding domain-containing protein [Deltaproteobacteria bacterium]|nr:cyclic nucleotide-binding domain-containing protein [Deltaproteobacteria bacterium]
MEVTRTGQFILSHQSCRSDDIQKGLLRQKDLSGKGAYRPIGQILVESGSLSPEGLTRALEQQCLEVLGRSEIFGGLSRAILEKVILETPLKTYPVGTVLMRQDEVGKQFYLLVSGKARAFRISGSGLEIPLAEFGPGQGFGEISVLARRPRTAFVQLVQPSSFLLFSEEHFFRMCRECPDLSMAVIRMLCERLTSGNLALDRISDEEFSVRRLFGRFVAPEVRDEILAGRISLDGEVRTVTLLFSDLRDFTPLTESTPPKTMVSILNAYFTEMTQAILSENGVVLQYVGDEVEAVFGAPLALPDHPDRAVRAALKMCKRLATLNNRLERTDTPPLRHGIGIHTGEVVAANIGSPDRKVYAMVGATVNLASRVQNENKTFSTDILITAATRAGLKESYTLRDLDPVSLKGVRDPVSLTEVL